MADRSFGSTRVAGAPLVLFLEPGLVFEEDDDDDEPSDSRVFCNVGVFGVLMPLPQWTIPLTAASGPVDLATPGEDATDSPAGR